MESLWLPLICAQPSLPLWALLPLSLTVKAAASVSGNQQLHDRLCRISGQGQTRLCCGSPWEGVTFHRECREWRHFQAVQATCWFLARSGEFSMQSVSLLVTGSSPSPQAHQGFLKENQNNLPKRLKTWGKISVMQRYSVMEGGTALPLCWL